MKSGLFFIFCIFLVGVNAQALDLQVRGFADLVGSMTSTQYPLNNIGNHEKHLTVDPESRLGLNLSADLGNDFTFASQILAHGSDGGVYKLSADWIFVNYKPIEGLVVRAGRQINPVFLYSEQIDVGFTYLWLRLPYELYGLYPIKSFNGVSVIYLHPMGDFNLRTQIFGGAGDVTIATPDYTLNGTSNDTKGAEISLFTDHLKFRVGYVAGNPTVTMTTTLGTSDVNLGSIQVFSTGVSYETKKFIAIAEGARFLGEGTFVHSGTGAYASFGYHVLPKLTPYITYSREWDMNGTVFIFPDSTVSTTPRINQYSYMLGANFKASSSLVLKAEYMLTKQAFEDSRRDFRASTVSGSLDMIF